MEGLGSWPLAMAGQRLIGHHRNNLTRCHPCRGTLLVRIRDRAGFPTRYLRSANTPVLHHVDDAQQDDRADEGDD